ncbi:MAG: polysaccharide biosynthesis protein PslG [Candidatus Binatota bacterium]|nr:polysaccharide biosynthesis protein PslG [Candidatus Binatota bacterium]
MLSVLALLVSLGVTSASAAAHGRGDVLVRPNESVPPDYFGMHVHSPARPECWPRTEFGSWRLWDSHVRWLDLQPARGQWNLDLLDHCISLAEARGVGVLLTLGQTPTWASTRPEEAGQYGAGASAEPRRKHWRAYLRRIARRYQARIEAYEVWNEPDLPTFFSGDADALVRLTRDAHDVVKAIDPEASIVSPSFTSKRGLPAFERYLRAGGAGAIDVVGYHFYVGESPPETMVALVARVRRLMAKYRIQEKPLWNTEAGWSRWTKFTSRRQMASYVARAYLLNWVAGVDRFYWYAWDNDDWVGIHTVEPDCGATTEAGRAYATIRTWMVGSRIPECRRDRQDTWVCTLMRERRQARIVWNPKRQLRFRVPTDWGANRVDTLQGDRRILAERAEVVIDENPRYFAIPGD